MILLLYRTNGYMPRCILRSISLDFSKAPLIKRCMRTSRVKIHGLTEDKEKSIEEEEACLKKGKANYGKIKLSDYFMVDHSEQETEQLNYPSATYEDVREKYKLLFERPKHLAHINDEPVIRRPGSIIDIKTLLRNNWAFPAVGFNSRLEIPVYKFEYDQEDFETTTDTTNENNGNSLYGKVRFISVPNEIFGVPIRSDILHKCYYFYRSALAGYTERMQLYKWEWPGSTRKIRSQKKSGKARMNWRKTSGRYLGVKNHPIRPHDQRTRINRKLLWKGMKIMLSAKFAQDQIKVVDHFLVKSHKTKYTVKYLRNLLGRNCNSALLVHEGKMDVNDNFMWACANIASIKRENVEGVNIYNLLKYRYVVFTYKALQNLMYQINVYPHKNKWIPTYATPDNKKAPIPEKVKNWNVFWKEKKHRTQFSDFNKEDLKERIKEWKWSSDLKGPLKIKKQDPYKNFILTKFRCEDSIPEAIKYEYILQTEDESDNRNDLNYLEVIQSMLDEEDYLDNINTLSLPLSELHNVKNTFDEIEEGESLMDEEDLSDTNNSQAG